MGNRCELGQCLLQVLVVLSTKVVKAQQLMPQRFILLCHGQHALVAAVAKAIHGSGVEVRRGRQSEFKRNRERERERERERQSVRVSE